MTITEILSVAAAGLSLVMLIWLVIISKLYRNIQMRYRKLLHGASIGNIEQILLNNQSDYKQLVCANDELQHSFLSLAKKVECCTQRIALKRYNPFEDVGGDLSFSAALLDAENNGIVLTSIYSQRESQLYAKPVKAGKSEYRLSSEEQAVLKQAMLVE